MAMTREEDGRVVAGPVNDRLRRARERTASTLVPGATLTRQELADLVNSWIAEHTATVAPIDANYIGKLERGLIRWPQQRYRAAFRACLDVTRDEDLGFHRAQRRPIDHETFVGRQDFLRGAVTVGLGAVVHPTGGDPSARYSGGQADDPISEIASNRVTLTDMDNRMGPGRVIPLVRQQLKDLDRLRRGDQVVNQRVATLYAQYCDLLAWLHQDMCQYAKAQYWLDRALEWTLVTGENSSAGFILARKCQLMTDWAQGHDAALHARSAISMIAGDHRLETVANMHGARAHALIGDDDEFWRLSDAAWTLLGPAREQPPGGWAWFCDESYLSAQLAHGRLLLGHDEAALSMFDDALQALPEGYPRDYGVYAARAAMAAARQGDVDTTVRHAGAAAALATSTGSARIQRELATLRHVIEGGAPGDPRLSEIARDVLTNFVLPLPHDRSGASYGTSH